MLLSVGQQLLRHCFVIFAAVAAVSKTDNQITLGLQTFGRLV